MLPERGGKEQQQQLSRKVSTGQAASKAQKRSVARATYLGRLASFSSFESLVLASVISQSSCECTVVAMTTMLEVVRVLLFSAFELVLDLLVLVH